MAKKSSGAKPDTKPAAKLKGARGAASQPSTAKTKAKQRVPFSTGVYTSSTIRDHLSDALDAARAGALLEIRRWSKVNNEIGGMTLLAGHQGEIERVTETTLRKSLNTYLSRTAATDEVFVVTRNGSDLAVLRRSRKMTEALKKAARNEAIGDVLDERLQAFRGMLVNDLAEVIDARLRRSLTVERLRKVMAPSLKAAIKAGKIQQTADDAHAIFEAILEEMQESGAMHDAIGQIAREIM